MISEPARDPQFITALEDLRRDAASTTSIRRIFSDYGIIAFMVLCYAYAAWLDTSPGSARVFGILAIVLLLNSVSSQRAERRHRLLLGALAELEYNTKLHGLSIQSAERRHEMLVEALTKLERRMERNGETPST